MQTLPVHPRSRLAPTPSGLLHVGNAVNFLLTWALVRNHHGTLLLRIDDMDADRSKPEFVEDIFRTLEWLGIDWDIGPEGPEEFYREYSFQTHKEHFRESMLALCQNTPELYACTCSRKQIENVSPDGLYPGTCRIKDHALESENSALRIHVPENSVLQVSGESIQLDRALGDFVLWRRDDNPSYQFASVLEDARMEINLIVRGEDLLVSSAAQLYLADRFGLESFLGATFFHHPLFRGQNNEKLSKSKRVYSLTEMKKDGLTPTDVYALIGEFLGMREKISCLDDLKEQIEHSGKKLTGVLH